MKVEVNNNNKDINIGDIVISTNDGEILIVTAIRHRKEQSDILTGIVIQKSKITSRSDINTIVDDRNSSFYILFDGTIIISN